LERRSRREDFGLPRSGAIYFCPQRPAKLHPAFDVLLGRLLDADPTGHVVLLEGTRRRSAAVLRSRLEASLGGKLASRILFRPPQPHEEYCRLLSLASVVLDTPVYSASLTGYDAFARGVPIVTLPGRLMVQRYAVGLYARMGVRGAVAADEDEYVALAVWLGRDPAYREVLSRVILDHCNVLFEDPRVIGEYEEFFRQSVQGTR
jgi:predicted O-linked N-acetylglucosamine transferase (SPINDLY family)